MIFFGWYTFLIRSYSFQDLGFSVEGSDFKQIEVRQRCFHLFWIPCFGIGKLYAMRMEGKLYELSPELEDILRYKMDHKTPWYTYSGLIIIILIYTTLTANEKIESYKYKKEAKELRDAKHDVLTHPIVGDEYLMETYIMRNEFYGKVAEVKKDSVLLKIVKATDENKSNWRYLNKISFADEDLEYTPQWVTTSELDNAMPIDNYYCTDSLQVYIPQLGGAVPYKIYELRRNGITYK